MRITSILLGLRFLTASCVVAQAQAMGHGHGTFITIDYHNQKFRYDFQDGDFNDTRSWKPETDESPLSVPKAVDIARVNLQRLSRKQRNSKLRTSSLNDSNLISGFLRSRFIAGISNARILQWASQYS